MSSQSDPDEYGGMAGDEAAVQHSHSRLSAALPSSVSTIDIAAGGAALLIGILAGILFITIPLLSFVVATLAAGWYLRREESLLALGGSTLYGIALVVALFPVVALLPQMLGSEGLGFLAALIQIAAISVIALLVAGALAGGGYLCHRRAGSV